MKVISIKNLILIVNFTIFFLSVTINSQEFLEKKEEVAVEAELSANTTENIEKKPEEINLVAEIKPEETKVEELEQKEIKTTENLEKPSDENLKTDLVEVKKESENSATQTAQVSINNVLEKFNEVKVEDQVKQEEIKEADIQNKKVEEESIKDTEEIENKHSIYSFLAITFVGTLAYLLILIYHQNKKYDFLNYDLNKEMDYELLADEK